VTQAALTARTAQLPEAFADRVPPDELIGLRSMAGGGEWGELLDLLLTVLVQTQAPVTATERDELRDILTAWDLPASQIADLAVER